MVFVLDNIPKTSFITYWENIKLRKQQQKDKNNQIEEKIVNRTFIKY